MGQNIDKIFIRSGMLVLAYVDITPGRKFHYTNFALKLFYRSIFFKWAIWKFYDEFNIYFRIKSPLIL